MRDVQIFDGKRTENRGLSSLHFVEFGFIEQRVLFEFLAHDSQSEFRAVNRDIYFGQNVGNGADVIFVRVGEDDGAHHSFILLQVGDVRDDDVHAEQFLLGKHQTSVNYDDVVAGAQREHVHAELAQPAQRNGP